MSNIVSSDPITQLEECAAAIRGAGCWDRIGMTERWPMSTEMVARLLRDGCEYEVPTASIRDLVRRGIVPHPGFEDQFEWTAVDVCILVSALEFRRLWRPGSQIHAGKKTKVEAMLDVARREGKVSEVVTNPVGIPMYDAAHIIEMLATCDDPAERRGFVTLLKMTLQHDHGVFIQ